MFFYIIPTRTSIISKITPGKPKIPTKRQVTMFIGRVINPVKLINHKTASPIIAFKMIPSYFLPLRLNKNLAIKITAISIKAIFN